MKIQHFYDPRTSTLTYVIHEAGEAVVIDPVLDYEPKSGRVYSESAEIIEAYLEQEELTLLYALDTHPHADHLSALAHFKQRTGCATGIAAGITQVQETWKAIFNFPEEFPTDGRQFDVLLKDGEVLRAGPLEIEAILTEGHTPASLTYKIRDALFVGDLIFMPDAGTARSDFPGGSAAVMHASIQKLFRLPGETRVFTLHDYQPGGRELRFESTIAEQRESNIQITASTTVEAFVATRRRLELGKSAPTLLYPAVQVNINGGRLPIQEANGVSYMKIPVTDSRE